jgi:hypothetical protein
MEWSQRNFDGDFGDCQADGSGRTKEFGRGKPEFGAPHGGVDDKNEPFAGHIRQSAMRGQGGRETGAKLLFQVVEP